VVIVFTDITRAASLWEHDATAMRDATAAHNDLVRSLIARHGGYEAGTGRERNTGEGSFCVVFTRAHDALRWCADVQRALLSVDWPAPLLTHPGAAEELWDGGHDDGERVIYRGLRVRMGVHAGRPRHVRDALTRRVEYVGSTVNAAARMTALAHGGQVVVSQQARDKLRAEASSAAELELGEADEKRLKRLGKFALPDSPAGACVPCVSCAACRVCACAVDSSSRTHRSVPVRDEGGGPGDAILRRRVDGEVHRPRPGRAGPLELGFIWR
jgi:class 3 adenylate cyclase